MKQALAAALLCVLAAPHTSGAQEAASGQSATWGFIAGGEGVTGAFRGNLAYGTTVGIVGQVPLSRHFSLRGDFLDHSVGTSHSQVGCGLTAPDSRGLSTDSCNHPCIGWLNCMPLSPWEMVTSSSVSVAFRLNDPTIAWSPYLLGGVAGYELERDNFASYHAHHIGLTGGIGVEYRPNKHTYFVEIRYLGIPPGGLTPVSVGMRF